MLTSNMKKESESGFIFTHAPPLEKVWRIPGVQCVSESALNCHISLILIFLLFTKTKLTQNNKNTPKSN